MEEKEVERRERAAWDAAVRACAVGAIYVETFDTWKAKIVAGAIMAEEPEE